MINKKRKVNRQELRYLVEKSLVRDEEKRRLFWSATTSVKEVLTVLDSSMDGLDAVQVRKNRTMYGKNERTDNKKKNVIQLILDSLDKPTCYVVRKNENLINIPSSDLVVGDIVHLSEGDVVPADLRVIESNGLTVNQKAVSDDKIVKKNAGICLGELEKVTDYFNIVLMGTNIIAGSGEGVVVSVGNNTILGTMP